MSDRAPVEFTKRERLVAMIEAGASPSVIAWSLNLSEKSVRAEIAGMKDAAQAAVAPVAVAEVAVERVEAAPVAEAPAPGDSWCADCAKKVFSAAGLAALDRRRVAGEGRRSAAGRAA